jgi:dTMP kinase
MERKKEINQLYNNAVSAMISGEGNSKKFKLEPGMGLFVVFEGIDGSGKSTLIKKIKSVLQQQDYVAIDFFEPTKQSESGMKLRKILTGKTKPSAVDEMNLFIEDREYDLTSNIIPALREDKIVLLDRYLFSSAAYQGRDELTSFEVLRNNLLAGFPLPHVLIYLDLPIEVSLQRIHKGRNQQELFETSEFLKSIQSNYESILPETYVRVNAQKPPDAIVDEVCPIIMQQYNQRKDRSI